MRVLRSYSTNESAAPYSTNENAALLQHQWECCAPTAPIRVLRPYSTNESAAPYSTNENAVPNSTVQWPYWANLLTTVQPMRVLRNWLTIQPANESTTECHTAPIIVLRQIVDSSACNNAVPTGSQFRQLESFARLNIQSDRKGSSNFYNSGKKYSSLSF